MVAEVKKSTIHSLKNSRGFSLVEIITVISVMGIIGLVIMELSKMGVDLAKSVESNLSNQTERALITRFFQNYISFAADLGVENNLENMKTCCSDSRGRVISTFRSNDYFRQNTAIPLMVFNRQSLTASSGGTSSTSTVGLIPTAVYFIPPNKVRPGRLIISSSESGSLSSQLRESESSAETSESKIIGNSTHIFDNIVEFNIGPVIFGAGFDGRTRALVIPIEVVTRKWLTSSAKGKNWCPAEIIKSNSCCSPGDTNVECISPQNLLHKDERLVMNISVVNNAMGLSTEVVARECRTVTINYEGTSVQKERWFRRRIPQRKNGPQFYFRMRIPGEQRSIPENTTVIRKE